MHFAKSAGGSENIESLDFMSAARGESARSGLKFNQV